MELLRIENLTFKYPSAEKSALKNISLTVNSGDFVLLCGQSGCGKTTLLKTLKPQLTPHGEMQGNVYFDGEAINALDTRCAASDIGFVMQNPESQIVTDKVWHELGFGLENLGIPSNEAHLRIAEMANFFGITDWYHKSTHELSGGAKQLLNLAAVMVMRPRVLLLDEPTAQLDPIAAADFITILRRLNKDLGLTIIIAEHRLEELMPIADNVVIMDGGEIIANDAPKNICDNLSKNHPMNCALPAASRIFKALDVNDDCPITVREGRNFLDKHFTISMDSLKLPEYTHSDNVCAQLKKVWFRYDKNEPDILRGVDLKLYEGEILSILGANGAGKSTLLNILAGLKKPHRGKVTISGKDISSYKNGSLYKNNIAMLPQNPQTVFLKDTVQADLHELCDVHGYSKDERAHLIETLCEQLGIKHLLNSHPYDLSGGEAQKCALAKTLLLKPKILLLDEPAKGIDTFAKQTLSGILKSLKSQVVSVIIVTHDVEFACECSERCALFFDGEILPASTPALFFSDNNYYTTSASRISRHIFKNAVTCDDVVTLCKLNMRDNL